MTTAQIIWSVIIAALAVVNVPFVLTLIKDTKPMAVDPRVQTSLDEITASTAAIAAKITADVTAGTAQATQDATDTAAAVQAAADALKAAVGS
jgi:hypothetical protein